MKHRRHGVKLAVLALYVGGSRSASGWTECSLNDVLDLGPATQLENFWQDYVLNWSSLHIDSGASLEDARFFAKWTRIFMQSTELFAAVASDCLFGVLTVFLQALPAIDYEGGRNEARDVLQLSAEILESIPQDEMEDAKAKASQEGWEVERLFSTFQLYQAVLGPGGKDKTVPCTGPKVFVYPAPDGLGIAPAELLHSGPAGYLPAMMSKPLQCLFGMYGTELLFHKRFQEEASSCRTDDPHDAEIFFVPSYFKCIEVLNYFDAFDSDDAEADLLFHNVLHHLRSFGPWFDRKDGADHVFLFSWGRHPCRIPGWRLGLRSAILLQVENHCEDLNLEKPEPSFSRWKDIIIPGHVDLWRARELLSKNRPLEDRDVLLCFHGRHAGNTQSYANVSVRTRIMEELAGLSGVSVGGFIEEYHVLMGRSLFCLAPRGITPWTIHLFVALLAGCIPVILSDDLEVPFQELLEWPDFSIKWPAENISELYGYLRSIPALELVRLKEGVDQHSCWFNYYSEKENCNPFAAVMTLLQRRVEQRPRYGGLVWGPNDLHSQRDEFVVVLSQSCPSTTKLFTVRWECQEHPLGERQTAEQIREACGQPVRSLRSCVPMPLYIHGSDCDFQIMPAAGEWGHLFERVAVPSLLLWACEVWRVHAPC